MKSVSAAEQEYPEMVIPDLAILHADPPPTPETIMHAMVNLITWISWSSQLEFHQVFLFPLFLSLFHHH